MNFWTARRRLSNVGRQWRRKANEGYASTASDRTRRSRGWTTAPLSGDGWTVSGGYFVTGDLFTNPVAWSSSMVGTWPRFWMFSLFLVGVVWLAILSSGSSGLHGAAWGLGFFISAYQLMLLYALRRLVLSLRESRMHAVAA